MNVMALSWVVVDIRVLVSVLASIALFWQVLRRREAIVALIGCQSQLYRLCEIYRQQEANVRELTAGMRAEKDHVEKPQWQVEFAREEIDRVRTEHRQQVLQIAILGIASAARTRYRQLLQQHKELKQAHSWQLKLSLGFFAYPLPSRIKRIICAPAGATSGASVTNLIIPCPLRGRSSVASC
jgi:DNA recombination protein RmuC